jgi:hypothetical protein
MVLAVAMVALPAWARDDPYRVEVWASVLFGADGKASEVVVVDVDEHPKAFLEAVRARLENARIEPRQLNGQAVTLRTGVKTLFEVKPDQAVGGSLRLLRLEMSPLPIKKEFVGYPKDVGHSDGWEGSVSAVCQVTRAGVCDTITVSALPGVPDSVKRFAKASLELWQFEPQQLDGQPIEGEYRFSVNLKTVRRSPEDFRKDKFDRVTRGR